MNNILSSLTPYGILGQGSNAVVFDVGVDPQGLLKALRKEGKELASLYETLPIDKRLALKTTIHFDDAAKRLLSCEIACLKLLPQNPLLIHSFIITNAKLPRRLVAALPHNITAHADSSTRTTFFLLEQHQNTLYSWRSYFPQPLPYHVAWRIAKDLTSITSFLSRYNVLHSDLKSDNVMIARDGRAVLIDFGIARVFHNNTLSIKYSHPFPLLMNESLLAPEILQAYYRAKAHYIEHGGDANLDKMDQETLSIHFGGQHSFSVGAILYELLLGFQPEPLSSSAGMRYTWFSQRNLLPIPIIPDGGEKPFHEHVRSSSKLRESRQSSINCGLIDPTTLPDAEFTRFSDGSLRLLSRYGYPSAFAGLVMALQHPDPAERMNVADADRILTLLAPRYVIDYSSLKLDESIVTSDSSQECRCGKIWPSSHTQLKHESKLISNIMLPDGSEVPLDNRVVAVEGDGDATFIVAPEYICHCGLCMRDSTSPTPSPQTGSKSSTDNSVGSKSSKVSNSKKDNSVLDCPLIPVLLRHYSGHCRLIRVRQELSIAQVAACWTVGVSISILPPKINTSDLLSDVSHPIVDGSLLSSPALPSPNDTEIAESRVLLGGELCAPEASISSTIIPLLPSSTLSRSVASSKNHLHVYDVAAALKPTGGMLVLDLVPPAGTASDIGARFHSAISSAFDSFAMKHGSDAKLGPTEEMLGSLVVAPEFEPPSDAPVPKKLFVDGDDFALPLLEQPVSLFPAHVGCHGKPYEGTNSAASGTIDSHYSSTHPYPDVLAADFKSYWFETDQDTILRMNSDPTVRAAMSWAASYGQNVFKRGPHRVSLTLSSSKHQGSVSPSPSSPKSSLTAGVPATVAASPPSTLSILSRRPSPGQETPVTSSVAHFSPASTGGPSLPSGPLIPLRRRLLRVDAAEALLLRTLLALTSLSMHVGEEDALDLSPHSSASAPRDSQLSPVSARSPQSPRTPDSSSPAFSASSPTAAKSPKAKGKEKEREKEIHAAHPILAPKFPYVYAARLALRALHYYAHRHEVAAAAIGLLRNLSCAHAQAAVAPLLEMRILPAIVRAYFSQWRAAGEVDSLEYRLFGINQGVVRAAHARERLEQLLLAGVSIDSIAMAYDIEEEEMDTILGRNLQRQRPLQSIDAAGETARTDSGIGSLFRTSDEKSNDDPARKIAPGDGPSAGTLSLFSSTMATPFLQPMAVPMTPMQSRPVRFKGRAQKRGDHHEPLISANEHSLSQGQNRAKAHPSLPAEKRQRPRSEIVSKPSEDLDMTVLRLSDSALFLDQSAPVDAADVTDRRDDNVGAQGRFAGTQSNESSENERELPSIVPHDSMFLLGPREAPSRTRRADSDDPSDSDHFLMALDSTDCMNGPRLPEIDSKEESPGLDDLEDKTHSLSAASQSFSEAPLPQPNGGGAHQHGHIHSLLMRNVSSSSGSTPQPPLTFLQSHGHRTNAIRTIHEAGTAPRSCGGSSEAHANLVNGLIRYSSAPSIASNSHPSESSTSRGPLPAPAGVGTLGTAPTASTKQTSVLAMRLHSADPRLLEDAILATTNIMRFEASQTMQSPVRRLSQMAVDALNSTVSTATPHEAATIHLPAARLLRYLIQCVPVPAPAVSPSPSSPDTLTGVRRTPTPPPPKAAAELVGSVGAIGALSNSVRALIADKTLVESALFVICSLLVLPANRRPHVCPFALCAEAAVKVLTHAGSSSNVHLVGLAVAVLRNLACISMDKGVIREGLDKIQQIESSLVKFQEYENVIRNIVQSLRNPGGIVQSSGLLSPASHSHSQSDYYPSSSASSASASEAGFSISPVRATPPPSTPPVLPPTLSTTNLARSRQTLMSPLSSHIAQPNVSASLFDAPPPAIVVANLGAATALEETMATFSHVDSLVENARCALYNLLLVGATDVSFQLKEAKKMENSFAALQERMDLFQKSMGVTVSNFGALINNFTSSVVRLSTPHATDAPSLLIPLPPVDLNSPVDSSLHPLLNIHQTGSSTHVRSVNSSTPTSARMFMNLLGSTTSQGDAEAAFGAKERLGKSFMNQLAAFETPLNVSAGVTSPISAGNSNSRAHSASNSAASSGNSAAGFHPPSSSFHTSSVRSSAAHSLQQSAIGSSSVTPRSQVPASLGHFGPSSQEGEGKNDRMENDRDNISLSALSLGLSLSSTALPTPTTLANTPQQDRLTGQLTLGSGRTQQLQNSGTGKGTGSGFSLTPFAGSQSPVRGLQLEKEAFDGSLNVSASNSMINLTSSHFNGSGNDSANGSFPSHGFSPATPSLTSAGSTRSMYTNEGSLRHGSSLMRSGPESIHQGETHVNHSNPTSAEAVAVPVAYSTRNSASLTTSEVLTGALNKLGKLGASSRTPFAGLKDVDANSHASRRPSAGALSTGGSSHSRSRSLSRFESRAPSRSNSLARSISHISLNVGEASSGVQTQATGLFWVTFVLLLAAVIVIIVLLA